MVKIELWRTPFSDASFPSIRSVTLDEDLQATVITKGGKYLVVFPFVATFRCSDESLPCSWLSSTPPGCSIIVSNSRWCRESSDQASYVDEIFGNLTHYVILGGDRVLEVLCSGQTKVISQ